MKEQRFVVEGTVLLQETCDEIHLDLDGNAKRINPHDEHWLVQEVRKEGFKLYNLDTQRIWIVSRGELNAMLIGNEKYKIPPMLRISDEVA